MVMHDYFPKLLYLKVKNFKSLKKMLHLKVKNFKLLHNFSRKDQYGNGTNMKF